MKTDQWLVQLLNLDAVCEGSTAPSMYVVPVMRIFIC